MEFKRHLKFVGIIGLAFAVVIGLFLSTSVLAQTEKKPVYLSMGTSSIGGTSHIIGSAMSKIIREEFPYIRIAAEVTGGSPDNLRLAETGKVQFGLSTADAVHDSYNGAGQFGFTKPNKNLRGVVSGYPAICQVYTLIKNDIKEISDLRGKKISLGAVGSIGNSIMPIILEEYGLKMKKDWYPEFLGHADGAGALADGHVDAVIIVGSTPIAAVMSISTTHDIRILSIDQGKLNAILAPRPFWKPWTIPPGIYRKVDYPVNTFLVAHMLFADKNVPEEIIYNITKAILENTDKLAKIHKVAGSFNAKDVKMAIEGVVPFHPGAEKYLKEKGILK